MYRVYVIKSKFAMFKEDLPSLDSAEKTAKLYLKNNPKSNLIIAKDSLNGLNVIKEIS